MERKVIVMNDKGHYAQDAACKVWKAGRSGALVMGEMDALLALDALRVGRDVKVTNDMKIVYVQ